MSQKMLRGIRDRAERRGVAGVWDSRDVASRDQDSRDQDSGTGAVTRRPRAK